LVIDFISAFGWNR